MTETLRECPFCASKKTSLRGFASGMHVMCLDCFAYGPGYHVNIHILKANQYNKERFNGARRLWNTRKGDPA